MKILYTGPDRSDAELAAAALQGITPDLALTWAPTPGSALAWLRGHREAAALVVGADVERQDQVVEQVRALGLMTPVVFVSASPEQALAALNAGADGSVVAGPSLRSELPRAVKAAIERRSGIEQRGASELAEAAARLADLQARHSAALTRESRICTALQQRLLELEAAVRIADERRAADAVTSADQLARRHAEFTSSLAQAAQSRDALAAKLADATAALDRAQEAHKADITAAAVRLREREGELGAQLHDAAAARAALEQSLAQAEAAQRDARERHEADLAVVNERQAALDDLLAQEADRCRVLDRKLAAAEAAVQESDRRRAKELEDAAAHLAALQAQYDEALAGHASVRAALEQQVSEAATALARVTRERDSEAAAAVERLRDREAELGARVAEATARVAVLDAALAQAETALHDAAQRAEADRAAADERRAALENLLAQESDKRTVLDRRAASLDASLQETTQRYTTELATAAANLAGLQTRFEAEMTEHAAGRAALEQRVSEADAARLQADERAADALAAAAARQTELAGHLAGESSARAQLETDLAGLREETARRRRRSLRVVVAARRRSREGWLRFEAQLAGERAAADRRLRAKDDEIREVRQERDRARHLLGTTQEQLRRLHASVDEERQAYARARETSESELQRVSGEYGQLRRSFDQLQISFQALERVAGEHAAERARLESVVAERDSQLSAQAERHRSAERIAQEAQAQLKERLRHVLETGRTETARLQKEIDELGRELSASRTHADALRGVAERVPGLEAKVELGARERRRQFERAPYGLCRCTADGVITDANHALVALLGRRRAEQLRNKDFAATVADSAGDLGWLLERVRDTGKAQAAETTWKTRHGRELAVRIQALPAADGSLDIVVEDVTRLRSLEERLRRAARMEAVGRLASEVTGTCRTLLGDAARDAREWLAAVQGDESLRRRGDMLLADLARAEGHLRQLGAFGEAQARALEPVSVQQVVRNLAAVLKRIAGDEVELVGPTTAGAFEVDVEIDPVERVLVGVAGCVRARMPDGGQLKIDLATATVGRRFLTRYPAVRPGPPVLVTLTARPRAAAPRGEGKGRAAGQRPPLELGGLADLVDACGGHLWMDAQPDGTTVAKIHLPKPAVIAEPDVPGLESPRGRLARWFRTSAGPVVRS